MKYIVKIDRAVYDLTLKKIKEHGKVIARLPGMEEGYIILIETNAPKAIENLPGILSFGPNRNATV